MNENLQTNVLEIHSKDKNIKESSPLPKRKYRIAAWVSFISTHYFNSTSEARAHFTDQFKQKLDLSYNTVVWEWGKFLIGHTEVIRSEYIMLTEIAKILGEFIPSITSPDDLIENPLPDNTYFHINGLDCMVQHKKMRDVWTCVDINTQAPHDISLQDLVNADTFYYH